MFSSLKKLKNVNNGISFEEFCRIIDEGGGCASEREGIRSIYDSKKEKQGFVVKEDALLIARVIIAQDRHFEW